MGLGRKESDYICMTIFMIVFSWLCGTQSPCADVGPNFPRNAEYYFNLEFSNRYGK